MKYLLVSLICFLCLGAATVQAEEKGDEARFGVLVTVTDFAGETIMNNVRNIIMKDLKSLHGVQIVEDRELADFALIVLPTLAQTTEGTDLGFGLFVLVTKPFREKDFDGFLDRAGLDMKENAELFPLRFATCSLDRIEYVGYRAGPPGALKEVCRKVAYNFDATCLEPTRKATIELRTKIKEMLKEHGGKKEQKETTPGK